ncbi:MAG: asparagine synthetase B [Polyangiaceae bacterium]
MCGIAGLFIPRAVAGQVDPIQLDALRVALLHRGPDGSAVWVSENGKCGLAHTRLAIVDLSPTGAQPMSSPDGRYHISFNGEIYNHDELRQELEGRGHVFRGRSDTEVLLRLFAERGERCLDSLDGMFAFAVYDAAEHSLFCARDPMGEKPLYLVRRRDLFAFASEVRALVTARVASGAPDLKGIGHFLRQGSIPPPLTHVEGVELLPPGRCIQVGPQHGMPVPTRYFRIPFVVESRAIKDRREAMERVHTALRASAKRRLRADVPVAAFLSGGIDSSVVTALMVEAGAKDLQTFTVTLPGRPDDESEAARAIARHLGVGHTQIPLELDARHDWLAEALDAMDVPSVDGPNTWLVSRAVRRAGLKVACSGLGGDELFFGYPSFDVVPRAARWLRPLSAAALARKQALSAMTRLPAAPRIGRAVDAALAGGSLAALWFAKRGLYSAHEVAELLDASAATVAARVDPFERLEQLGCPRDLGSKRKVSFYELGVYMHDQLLRDTDCMSMAHALEVRVPLIGREVIEAVTGLAQSALDGPRPKQLLRDIARHYLPPGILELPKHGFSLDWVDIMASRTTPSDPTAGGLLRPGAWARERALLQSTHRSFARFFALDVLTRKTAPLPRAPSPETTGARAVGDALGI